MRTCHCFLNKLFLLIPHNVNAKRRISSGFKLRKEIMITLILIFLMNFSKAKNEFINECFLYPIFECNGFSRMKQDVYSFIYNSFFKYYNIKIFFSFLKYILN